MPDTSSAELEAPPPTSDPDRARKLWSGVARALRPVRRAVGKLTHAGVDPTLPRQATMHIVLTNQLALFGVVLNLVSLLWGFGAAAMILPAVQGWMLAYAVAGVLIVVLNRRGWHLAATLWMMASSFVFFTASSFLQPLSTNQNIYLGLMAAASWFLFPPGKRLWPWVATITAYVLLFVIYFGMRDRPPPPQLPAFDRDFVAQGNVGIVFWGSVFLCARAAVEMMRVQKELADERAKTEALLKREVAHQVAERSRELGAALAWKDGPVTTSALATASRFGARYRVHKKLGEGAMGAVFEVERLTDGQRLALKVMTGSHEHAARFAREAEIGARVTHPNVVSIVDIGIAEGGAPFLAMELVTGGSVEDRHERFGDVAWSLPILRDVLRGLEALHAAGVVHRDLKPGNVLLDERGVAKLTDFGIARIGLSIDGDSAPSRPGKGLTATGAWFGTPFYMPPEAARGGREVGPAGDVFAFGVMAYELLSGERPFDTPPVFLALAGQRMSPPRPLAAEPLDPALRETILACFSEDPTQRPDTRHLGRALGLTQ